MDGKNVIILEKIGEGSFGSVHRCYFKHQFCALKIIKLKDGGCTEWNWECIKREFLLLNRLCHPNIVNMLYFYQIKSQCEFRFVLQLMPNGSLRDLLRRFKINFWKFNERDLLSFALDIAIGLKYLHQNGVIHRDLKPENLLFDENYRLKITDFGVSKLTVNNNFANHTRVGTLAYMAPEVFLNHAYDNSVDVWGFGVIFTEMVLIDYPLKREEKERIMNFSIKYKPMRIDMARRNYSNDAQLVIDASLQRDPCLRWGIADICRLPIFSKSRQYSELVSQIPRVPAPLPKPTAPKKKLTATHNNKENIFVVDEKNRRETNYEQFIQPLIKQIRQDHQITRPQQSQVVDGRSKMQNENGARQQKIKVTVDGDRKKSPEQSKIQRRSALSRLQTKNENFSQLPRSTASRNLPIVKGERMKLPKSSVQIGGALK